MKRGNETKTFRESLGLKKINGKAEPVRVAVRGLMVPDGDGNRGRAPTTSSIYYLVPLRWHRRELHRLKPEKKEAPEGGMGRIYPSKKGTLVKHIRYGLCYICGNLKERSSLHCLKDGKRLMQNAKREDFKILTSISWRTQFLPQSIRQRNWVIYMSK